MKFVFLDGVVGPLQPGMSRAQVRQAMAIDFNEFKKVQWAKVPADEFRDAHMHVFYTDDDLVRGLEVFPPSEFYYNEVNLIGLGVSDLARSLVAAGVAYEEDELGLTMSGGRIALYVPGMGSEVNSLVRSVYVDFD